MTLRSGWLWTPTLTCLSRFPAGFLDVFLDLVAELHLQLLSLQLQVFLPVTEGFSGLPHRGRLRLGTRSHHLQARLRMLVWIEQCFTTLDICLCLQWSQLTITVCSDESSLSKNTLDFEFILQSFNAADVMTYVLFPGSAAHQGQNVRFITLAVYLTNDKDLLLPLQFFFFIVRLQ